MRGLRARGLRARGLRPGAAAVLGVFAFGLAVTGCAGGGESGGAAAGTPAASPSTSAPPYKTFGDNGQVRVVEQGFSTIEKKGDFSRLSYGIVLENANPKAVAFPTIKLTFVGAAGKPVTEGGPGPSTPRILPGGRFGVGGSMPLPDPSKVTAVQVEFIETEWVTDNSQGRFTKLVAEGVRTERDVPSPGRATLRFTIDSGFAKPVPAVRASAIFRDGAGKLVGGADDGFDPENFVGKDIRPGRSELRLMPRDGIPEEADDARTEVYVHPDQFPFPP